MGWRCGGWRRGLGMRIKAGASWRLPRFTTAAGVAMQSGSVGSGYKRSATGCCGLMPGGPEGLIDGKAPGRAPKLNGAQRQELARIIESGPIPAIHGVVRWRLIDLAQWVWEEYRVRVAKQTLSRQLRAMGSASSRPGRATCSWIKPVGTARPSSRCPTTSPSSYSHPARPSSTRSRMSGSSCGTTGCRTGSSHPMTTSSTTAVRLGTSSSIDPGPLCPSARAIGPIGHDHRDLVLGEIAQLR